MKREGRRKKSNKAFFSDKTKKMVTKEGKQKIRALMPSLREKKRYLSFEIISEKPISQNQASNAIIGSFSQLYGQEGLSKSGMMLLHNKYLQEKNRGIIKVSHKWADKLRLALAMIKQIDSTKIIIKSITTSGAIRNAAESINNSI